jgi:DNA-3-methyladenine glycosylase
MPILNREFFERDACIVAQGLLGKVLRRRFKQRWLSARIIETEAYYLTDRASHSSLGYTEKRKPLFMPAGTIYMYYARGRDSLNVSCQGRGNAVLMKSAYPYLDALSDQESITNMQTLHATGEGGPRPVEKLCAGQTLLCQSLALTVTEWNGRQFDRRRFYIEDVGIVLDKILQTTRLGIAPERDPHLMYRFIDYEFAKFCTSNPLAKRDIQEGVDYRVLHCTERTDRRAP